MNDESSNSNLEWKKTGFDFNEKLTLKTNVAKAISEERKNKNAGLRTLTPGPINLPNGLKKIRKKIKEVYDEDEEEEDEYGITNIQMFAPLEESDSKSSLLNALRDDEKKSLHQQETLQMMQAQQETGKMNAILQANKLAKENGLGGLNKKVMNQNIQELPVNTDFTSKALKESVSTQLKLKSNKINDADAIKLMTGAKQVMKYAGEEALREMNIKSLVELGGTLSKEKDPKVVAKMILEKSGRIDIDGKTIRNPKKSISNNKKKEAILLKKMQEQAKNK